MSMFNPDTFLDGTRPAGQATAGKETKTADGWEASPETKAMERRA